MTLTILPMDPQSAKEAASWQYPGEYAIYNGDPEELSGMLAGEYYAAFEHGKLVGFFCFGASARVPTDHTPNPYGKDALDVGLGMRPERCGQGHGAEFLQAGLEFAQKHFAATRFRLTVMTFNCRAIHAYEKAGFELRRIFENRAGTARFQTMELEIPAGKEGV